jgi:hypothetical protein
MCYGGLRHQLRILGGRDGRQAYYYDRLSFRGDDGFDGRDPNAGATHRRPNAPGIDGGDTCAGVATCQTFHAPINHCRLAMRCAKSQREGVFLS